MQAPIANKGFADESRRGPTTAGLKINGRGAKYTAETHTHEYHGVARAHSYIAPSHVLSFDPRALS